MNVSSTDVAVDLVHTDAWIVVVYKPVGMPVQADRTGDRSLLEVVRTNTGRPELELVNRIDRPVSGLVLLAERGYWQPSPTRRIVPSPNWRKGSMWRS